MTIKLFAKETFTPRVYRNCEIILDNDFQTEYFGIEENKSYTIVIDKFSMDENNGTVYESMFNEKTGNWEDYDMFYFYPTKMQIQ